MCNSDIVNVAHMQRSNVKANWKSKPFGSCSIVFVVDQQEGFSHHENLCGEVSVQLRLCLWY